MSIRDHRRAARAALGSAFAVAAAFAAFVACYPDLTDVNSSDTVTTLRAPSADFTTPTTFVVPDSVVHIVAEGETDNISHSVDEAILSSIRRNMIARGYVEELDPAHHAPDLAVTAAATTTTNIVYYYYDWWSYWGWYPYWPGYGAGWGWYYPGYTPVPYVYQTGTVLMSLIDLKKSDPANKQVIVNWIAGLNGLLSSVPSPTRVSTAVDQAFAQSPYLKK